MKHLALGLVAFLMATPVAAQTISGCGTVAIFQTDHVHLTGVNDNSAIA